MANEEHLKILRKGVEEWNRWRAQHRERRLGLERSNLSGAALRGVDLSEVYLNEADLREADLREAQLGGAMLDEANLRGANLRGAYLNGAYLGRAYLSRANLSGAELGCANLVQADLREANLSGANLSGADLTVADLRGADLHEAELRGAELRRADLSGANLSGADLESADLSGADLSEADVADAHLSETVLADVDLGSTRNVDSWLHGGPSILDHRTLQRSGQLPLVFLRGCGLPDHFIDNIPGLFHARPIQFYSCFISYSSKDQECAQRIYADLQNNGVRCWYAAEDVQGGKKLHEQIDTAIRLHEKLLLILSRHSMSSEWVKTELAKARKREVKERKRILFPISLTSYEEITEWECFDADTGKDSAREIREYFIPDFTNWKNHDDYQKAFDRLLHDLKQE